MIGLRAQVKSLFRRFAVIGSIAILGAVGTAMVWAFVFAAETRALVSEFSTRANNQATILQERIDDYWDIMYATRALFYADGAGVSRRQFEIFANELLHGHPAILNLAWLPRIKRDERAAHEAAAARDGIANYHIRRVGADGTLPIAPESDEYFPKFYSTEARTSPVYGINTADAPGHAHLLDRIRDADALSISPPLVLRIGEGDRHGFLAAVPVYAPGLPHQTIADRRRNLIGFVQGVFQIHVMIDAILGNIKTPVRVYLFAPDSGADAPSVYSKSRMTGAAVEAEPLAKLAAGMHRLYPIKFGDVQWTLVVTPEAGALFAAGHGRSWMVLAFGLLLTGAGMFVAANASRWARVIENQRVRLSTALNNMAQGLCMFDSEQRLLVANRRFAEMFRIPPKDLRPATPMRDVMALAQMRDRSPEAAAAAQAHFLANPTSGSALATLSDGRIIAIAHRPMRNGGVVATFDDITEQRLAEQRIQHLAHYDSLTDLANRLTFYERMEAILKDLAPPQSLIVLSLDLDHFKSVNDTLGHPVGDLLLQAAAERMRNCIRDNDMAARLGGDEFAIILPVSERSPDAAAFATRLIATVGAPYNLDGREVLIGVSVGIAIAPGDGSTPDTLMKNADLALYRAKADGGNAYRFFEPEMDARMQMRRVLELDLRKAVLNKEFEIHYQPIVDIKSGRITTCEALLRWRHPERGIVPPLEFIPVAEETNLIVPIGEWVLARACADAAEWPDEITVAVNVSPIQFKSGHFVQSVAQALQASRLPAKRLELEITEMVLMQDNDAALTVLTQLNECGVTIAMDDFGTGYSSLSYLRSFPFNKIKIDQSFISDLSKNKDSLVILRAVVGLGRSLGIVTTAEGVETREQLELLLDEGCAEAQGYLFSEPKPAAAIKELLRAAVAAPRQAA